MYKYETHLHTSPVSNCAGASVRESLEFYKKIGYDGVFITNHFLDGNLNVKYRELPYDERINFYFSDFENGQKIGKEIGIKVFGGVELSYLGTDFLVYGLNKEWYLKHPEIMDMKKSEELPFLAENGAFIVHAHPFREKHNIDHVRLYTKEVHGVEVINSQRSDFENKMAEIYAECYGFYKTAGSDNHIAARHKHLAGMETDIPIADESDFIQQIKNGQMRIFTMENPLISD